MTTVQQFDAQAGRSSRHPGHSAGRRSGGIGRHLARHSGSYIILIVFTVLIGFPIYFAIVGSFMGPEDLNAYPTALWPVHGFHLSNYIGALDTIPLLRQWGNSLVVSIAIMIGQLVTSMLAAFALVFLPMKFRGVWFSILLSTMMVPLEAIIIPNYLLISHIGLMDSIIALILPFLAQGFGIFLLRQAYLSFPLEIYEAAKVDGCSNLRFLFGILMPITRPTMLAVGVWSFMSAWNMYFWPLLVTQSPSMQTIQIGITQLSNADSFNAGLVLAGSILAVIPTLLLLIFGQRLIVRGLVGGAVK